MRPRAGGLTFDEFYRRGRGRAVRTAYLLTRSTVAAEDVAQEAYARLYSRWSELRDPDAYLHRSIVNLVRDAGRRAVHRDRYAATLRSEEALPPEVDVIWTALEELTPGQREAIVLRYYLDLRIADISRVTGRPEATVKSHLRRGLERIKRELDDDGD